MVEDLTYSIKCIEKVKELEINVISCNSIPLKNSREAVYMVAMYYQCTVCYTYCFLELLRNLCSVLKPKALLTMVFVTDFNDILI